MSGIVIGIIAITVIGIICGIILTIASKVMAVAEDERIPLIRECLPGANCGACGYAGCDGYAKALVEDEGVKTNLCVPGAEAVSQKISDILGVAFEDVASQVAVVRCRGDYSATEDKMDYRGIESCAAAKLFFGGRGMCTFGCMSLGDCAKACPNDAICLENGIARIDTRKCTGCGICTKTCPNNLIALTPGTAKVIVACSSSEKGASVRKKCSYGCIACKKCEKECPVGAVTVEGNLARIDQSKCTGCGKCAEVCMTGCITALEFSKA